MAGHAKRKTAEAAAGGGAAGGGAASGGTAAEENRKADKAPAAGDAKSVEKAAKAPTKKAAATPRKRKSSKKQYDRTNEYKALKKALELAIRESGGAPDEIQLSQIDEYMDLWVQRKLLRDEVRAKGVTVYDERGRAMENRSISLGIQTSKLMAALRKELGLVKEPVPILGTEGEEDDEL